MSHRDNNQQRHLGNAAPLESLRKVAVIYKGEKRSTHVGNDLEELQARAHRFAAAQHWRGAIVEVVR